MIETLSELSEVITQVVNRVVDVSTKQTSTGNWIMEYPDVMDLISEQDYYQYFELIAEELRARDEVLDLDSNDHQLDAIYGLSYCSNYEWCDGDERVFGCDRAQWERTFQPKPVSQPLSMSRMAELGEKAIAYVLKHPALSLNNLTQSIGITPSELEQLIRHAPLERQVDTPIMAEASDAQKDRASPCNTVTDTCRDLLVGKWRVRYVPYGGYYGQNNTLINQGKPLLAFYDTSVSSEKFGPEGQYISAYYADTLLGKDGWSTGAYPYGLQLDASIPAWTVSFSEMQEITRFLLRMSRQPSLLSKIGDAESRKSTSAMGPRAPIQPEHE